MSGGVNTRPVPVSLLRWPRTRDLVTQYKGILMYMWAHPEQTACGCYLFPLDATAADLSMSSPSLADAMHEFQRRKLVDLDQSTGEIMLPDWFRWYTPRTPAARGAAESAIRKILSTDLRGKVENSYKSMAPAWKGKEKEKVTPPPPPSFPSVGEVVVGIEDLVEAAMWAAGTVGNPGGYRVAVRNRLQLNAPTADDLATLAAWRAAMIPRQMAEVAANLPTGRWISPRGSLIVIDNTGPISITTSAGQVICKPRDIFARELARGEVQLQEAAA